MGVAYQRLGDAQPAAACFRKAAELAPGNPTFQNAVTP